MKNARKEELEGKWKKLVVQAVTDDNFKERLVERPIEIMADYGLTVPEGVDVRTVRDNVITLIDPKDAEVDLAEELRWWRIRLDVIAEFGKEDSSDGGNTGPESEEGEDI